MGDRRYLSYAKVEAKFEGVIIGLMAENQSFEFDETKSQSNKQKHGIDFIEAQALWDDDDLLQISGTSESEPRFLVFGKIQDKHWTAVITYRLDKIRIISVRRSRTNEVTWYESRRI